MHGQQNIKAWFSQKKMFVSNRQAASYNPDR